MDSSGLKDINAKVEYLKKNKRRITPQLLEVLRIISRNGGHFTASDIYNEIKKTFPSISLNTVYCILKKLNNVGDVQEVVTLGKETNYCPNGKQHHHVICSKCKKIEDVELKLFDINAVKKQMQTDYEIENYSVMFNGFCKVCREKGAS